MGEFDLSLIAEFRSRPSFYDRNSPRFKDKLYNAHEWQEISNKLGFDVSILKDRILQLRNRYNLEKRRIEQLKEENPTKQYESPWPLYDHLHFLSDHIRARRSYKKMLPLNGAAEKYLVQRPSDAGPDLSNSGSNNSTGNLNQSGDGGDRLSVGQNMAAFPNGLLAVKMEDDSEETEAETESQNNDSEINTYEPTAVTHSSSTMPPLQQPQQHQHRQRHNNANNQYNQRHEQQQLQQQQHHKQQQQHHPTISIRRLDTLRPDFTTTSSSTPPNNTNAITSSRKRSYHAMTAAACSTTAYNQQQQLSSLRQSNDDNESAISSVVVQNKRPRHLNGRELKYTAFGNFISSSLMDLPASIALELVEKFTSDVVKALMEKAEQEQHCKDVENFN